MLGKKNFMNFIWLLALFVIGFMLPKFDVRGDDEGDTAPQETFSCSICSLLYELLAEEGESCEEYGVIDGKWQTSVYGRYCHDVPIIFDWITCTGIETRGLCKRDNGLFFTEPILGYSCSNEKE